MTATLTFLILIAPFVVAAAQSWAAHRSDSLRMRLDEFRAAAPMVGRLFDPLPDQDRDAFRIGHELDAIRTRFEKNPVWPASGAMGERR
jgi:hypothetical protein